MDRQLSQCCRTFVQSLPSAWLVFWIRAVISLLKDPLLDIVLSRFLKESMFFNCVMPMEIHGCQGALFRAGWGRSSIFLGLIVRPNTLDASANLLTVVCRWFSKWAIRLQSSTNNASVISLSRVFAFALRHQRSNTCLRGCLCLGFVTTFASSTSICCFTTPPLPQDTEKGKGDYAQWDLSVKDIKVETPLHRDSPTLLASDVSIKWHEESLYLESPSAALDGHVTLYALTYPLHSMMSHCNAFPIIEDFLYLIFQSNLHMLEWTNS